MISISQECKTKFTDYKDQIREVFSTTYILNCHKKGDYKVYEEIFDLPKIAKIFADDELIFTIEHFLDNNLNLTHAGRSAFMHRNTMIYRVNKVSKITGLDLKTFKDAQIFSNMLLIFNIIKEKREAEAREFEGFRI